MAPRKHDTPGIDREREIDRLYRIPLDDFVQARNDLTARLRDAGLSDDAREIKELKKPSVTAWAMNQVWWTDRRTFERLLDAGRTLRDQQRLSLAGKPAKLR